MAVETELNLDVSAEEARALHRVVRAMHDGHCPKCGFLDSASRFCGGGGAPCGHQCPNCLFTITSDEAIAALQAFQPYLKRSVEVFDRWRESRTQ